MLATTNRDVLFLPVIIRFVARSVMIRVIRVPEGDVHSPGRGKVHLEFHAPAPLISHQRGRETCMAAPTFENG